MLFFYFELKRECSCVTSKEFWFLHTFFNHVRVRMLNTFKTFFVVNLSFVLDKHKPSKAIVAVEFVDKLLTEVTVAKLQEEEFSDCKGKIILVVTIVVCVLNNSLLARNLFFILFIAISSRLASKVDSFNSLLCFIPSEDPSFGLDIFLVFCSSII